MAVERAIEQDKREENWVASVKEPEIVEALLSKVKYFVVFVVNELSKKEAERLIMML